MPPFTDAVPESERALGLGLFATDTPGLGGRLRLVPEDFQVEEASRHVAQASDGGKYTLATVRARNWETHRMVRQIAGRLGISERRIFFAGTKDKRAVTVQNLAIAAPEEQVQALDLGDLEVLATRRVDRAPKVGELDGNHFTIRLREMDAPLDEALARAEQTAEQLLALGGFPNFFGPQRFGAVRPITHEVGRAIVQGDLAEAVWTYVAAPSEHDPATLARARQQVFRKRVANEALDTLPPGLDYERMLLRHLAEQPDDAAGALDQLPRTLGRLFVGAYQSLLFNRMLVRRAALGHPGVARVGDLLAPADAQGRPDVRTLVPVTDLNLERCIDATERGVGFTTGAIIGHARGFAHGDQGALERAVVEEEGVDLDGFRIPDAPWLASAGTRRALWCPLDALTVEGGRDEHGAFLELAFFLPKGSYATCVLREFMKADLPAYA